MNGRTIQIRFQNGILHTRDKVYKFKKTEKSNIIQKLLHENIKQMNTSVPVLLSNTGNIKTIFRYKNRYKNEFQNDKGTIFQKDILNLYVSNQLKA